MSTSTVNVMAHRNEYLKIAINPRVTFGVWDLAGIDLVMHLALAMGFMRFYSLLSKGVDKFIFVLMPI
jgi:hypothetical protein